MARKKHLINVHTSTGTTAPSGASLYLGEIAVQHTSGSPALWIKVGATEASTDYEKFIGRTEILNLLEETKILGPEYTYSGLSYVNSSTTIAAAYSALTKEMIDDEAVTAAALNDINNRISELSGNSDELTQYLQENEEIVAGALNSLNNRVSTVETRMNGDYIPITGYELASGLTEEELSLNEEDTVSEAFGKLQKQMLDNEEAFAAGLNYLNEKVDDVEASIAQNTGITQLSGAVRSLSSATINISSVTQTLSSNTNNKFDQLSGAVLSISAKTSGVLTINANGVEQGKYSPSANTTINLEIIQEVTGDDVLLTGYELATGTTEEELAIVATDTVNEAFGKLQKQNYDNEAVIAGSFNDLDERISYLEANSGSSEGLEELSAAVISKEYVIAAALNDLNARIVDLSGNTGGGSEVLVTQELTAGTLIATISVDGNATDLYAPTGGGGGGNYDALSAATHTHVTNNNIHVTSSQKTSWTNGANSGASAYTAVTALSAATTAINGTLTTVSGAAHTKITNLSGATTGINATLTAHTGNGDIHVTANQKTTWDGKQDAISDLAAIRNGANSGASAYTAVTALSAATTAHTGNGDIHVTAAQKTAWTNGSNSGASAYTAVTALSAATPIDSNLVHKTGQEVIAGDKDFTNNVTVEGTFDNSSVAGFDWIEDTNGNSVQDVLDTKLSSADTASVFVAICGVTTYTEITQAISKRKVMLAKESTGDSKVYTYCGNIAGAGAQGYTFVYISYGGTGTSVKYISCSSSNVWKSQDQFLWGDYDTVTSVTSSSDDNHVPTAKAVYSAIPKTGTTNTTVARGSDFLAVSGATTANTSNITALSAGTTAHTATTIPSRTSAGIHLPTVTSSDNYKIPMVSGGTWTLTPVTAIYTGSGQPAQNMGNDGDIYLQTS